MVNSKFTVRDKLGDPAIWSSVPDGFYPPNDSYLLARLASISCYAEEVHIVFTAEGEQFKNTLAVDSDAEAELIVARTQQRVGDLLLEAIDTPLEN